MFNSFVMFAAMRTGSNFLEANLNAMDGVTCHGEAFNPAFVGKLNRSEAFGIDIAAREADPFTLLSALRGQEGLNGFRQFMDHDPRITESVLADPACAKIVLTRNPLESYISLLIARETGQWKLTQVRRHRGATVRFDAQEFERHVGRLEAFYAEIQRKLQVTGQTAFWIDYEDLADLEVLNGLAGFLGVEGRLSALDPKLKKQNPEPLAEKVENPEEMEAALAAMDRFSVLRVPNFEPPRASNLPSFVTCATAPLLFMPVRGGPTEAVAAWLAAQGEMQTDFDWRSLRKWRLGNPGYLAFTVLRHPLARAHDVFVRDILSGARPEIRHAMVRSYGIPLPAVGAVQDFDSYRDCFLQVLRFLKPYLAGQTGLRIDGGLATQAAVLEGFSRLRAPDFVFRERRLGDSLRFMADQLDLVAPEPQPIPEAGPYPLSALVDDEIEAAARDAYARDYNLFGFGDWRDD